MVGENPHRILRCEAENLGLMRAQVLSLCSLAEDAILDRLAGMARQEEIERKLARIGFHHSPGVIRERCWVLDESRHKGDWSLKEVTEGLGVD
jgi:hypothetical protein